MVFSLNQKGGNKSNRSFNPNRTSYALKAVPIRSFKANAACLSASWAVIRRQKHPQCPPSKFEVAIVLPWYLRQLICMIYMVWTSKMWSEKRVHFRQPCHQGAIIICSVGLLVVFFTGVTVSCVSRILVTPRTDFGNNTDSFLKHPSVCFVTHFEWTGKIILVLSIHMLSTQNVCFLNTLYNTKQSTSLSVLESNTMNTSSNTMCV